MEEEELTFYQELFQYMDQDHNIQLLDTDMDEIRNIVQKHYNQ